MAVTIDTYYSEKIIEGAKPSIPDTPETEIPPVLNPPGTGNTTTYKQLGDTTDKSFVGKEGYVPVVVGDVLTLVPMPNSLEDGLISPGVVQWTGTGYVFNVSGAIYRIAGTPYSSDADQVTLATPDATFDRIDVFAVDNTGSVVVLTGTPSSSPVKPQINPTTQVELTSVIVTAASSTPTLTEEVIYDENVEWTGTSSGTGTANFSSATNPFQGSVSVETTNIQNGFYVQFDNGSTIDISDYQTLGFQLDLKSSMGSGQNIFISFLDGSGVAASTTRQLSFDKSSTDYQFVGLVLSSISFTTTSIRYVRFSFVRYSGPVTHAGYFFDILKLEGGINPPVTIGSFLGLSDTPSSYLGQASKVVSVSADETRLEFTTPGGGGGTDANAVHYNAADGKSLSERQQAANNTHGMSLNVTTVATAGRLDDIATPTDVLVITSSTDLTGFIPTTTGFLRVVIKNGTFALIRNNSTFSGASNRVVGLSSNIRIVNNQYFDLFYDTAQSRWIPVGYQQIKANGAVGNVNSNAFRGNSNIQSQEIFEVYSSTPNLRFSIRGDGLIVTNNMPTADPLILGALWNDSGTVKISAG